MKKLKLILSVFTVFFLMLGLLAAGNNSSEKVVNEQWGRHDEIEWQEGLALTPVAHLEDRLLELEITRRDLNRELSNIESNHDAFENTISALTYIDDEIVTINQQMNQLWAVFNRETEYARPAHEFADDFYNLDMSAYYMKYEPFLPYFETPPARMSDIEIAEAAALPLMNETVITTNAQLNLFLTRPVGDPVFGPAGDDGHFRLGANVTAPTTRLTGRPGIFTGIFDGAGHTITGLRLGATGGGGAGGAGVGFIQEAGSGAVIRDVNFTNTATADASRAAHFTAASNRGVGTVIGTTTGVGAIVTIDRVQIVGHQQMVQTAGNSTGGSWGGMVGRVADGTTLNMRDISTTGAVEFSMSGATSIINAVGGFVGSVGTATGSGGILSITTTSGSPSNWIDVDMRGNTRGNVTPAAATTAGQSSSGVHTTSGPNLGGGVLGFVFSGHVNIENTGVVSLRNPADPIRVRQQAGGIVGGGNARGTIRLEHVENHAEVQVVMAGGENTANGRVGGLVGRVAGTLHIYHSSNHGLVRHQNVNPAMGGLLGYSGTSAIVVIEGSRNEGALRNQHIGSSTAAGAHHERNLNPAAAMGGIVGRSRGRLTITNTINANTNTSPHIRTIGLPDNTAAQNTAAINTLRAQGGFVDKTTVGTAGQGNNTRIGGIVGRVHPVGGQVVTLNNVTNLADVRSGPAGGVARGSVGGIFGEIMPPPRGNTTITLTNVLNEGTIIAGREAGGIIGWARPAHISIRNATNRGSLVRAGTVSPANTRNFPVDTGGIIGRSGGVGLRIDNAVNHGHINDTAARLPDATFGALHAGGIIGRSTGRDLRINDAYNNGNIRALHNAGGIVGLINGHDATINGVINHGEVYAARNGGQATAGGILGRSGRRNTIIRNAGNFGNVRMRGGNNNADGVAGILGRSYGAGARIEISFNQGTVSGRNSAGGIVGRNQGTLNITDVYNIGAVTGGVGNETIVNQSARAGNGILGRRRTGNVNITRAWVSARVGGYAVATAQAGTGVQAAGAPITGITFAGVFIDGTAFQSTGTGITVANPATQGNRNGINVVATELLTSGFFPGFNSGPWRIGIEGVDNEYQRTYPYFHWQIPAADELQQPFFTFIRTWQPFLETTPAENEPVELEITEISEQLEQTEKSEELEEQEALEKPDEEGVSQAETLNFDEREGERWRPVMDLPLPTGTHVINFDFRCDFIAEFELDFSCQPLAQLGTRVFNTYVENGFTTISEGATEHQINLTRTGDTSIGLISSNGVVGFEAKDIVGRIIIRGYDPLFGQNPNNYIVHTQFEIISADALEVDLNRQFFSCNVDIYPCPEGQLVDTMRGIGVIRFVIDEGDTTQIVGGLNPRPGPAYYPNSASSESNVAASLATYTVVRITALGYLPAYRIIYTGDLNYLSTGLISVPMERIPFPIRVWVPQISNDEGADEAEGLLPGPPGTPGVALIPPINARAGFAVLPNHAPGSFLALDPILRHTSRTPGHNHGTGSPNATTVETGNAYPSGHFEMRYAMWGDTFVATAPQHTTHTLEVFRFEHLVNRHAGVMSTPNIIGSVVNEPILDLDLYIENLGLPPMSFRFVEIMGVSDDGEYLFRNLSIDGTNAAGPGVMPIIELQVHDEPNHLKQRMNTNTPVHVPGYPVTNLTGTGTASTVVRHQAETLNDMGMPTPHIRVERIAEDTVFSVTDLTGQFVSMPYLEVSDFLRWFEPLINIDDVRQEELGQLFTFANTGTTAAERDARIVQLEDALESGERGDPYLTRTLTIPLVRLREDEVRVVERISDGEYRIIEHGTLVHNGNLLNPNSGRPGTFMMRDEGFNLLDAAAVGFYSREINAYSGILNELLETDETGNTYIRIVLEPRFLEVTFDLQGGNDENFPAIIIRHGNSVERPVAEPTQEGYHFIGWFTTPEDGTAFNFETSITENITLYARWSSVVTFEFTKMDNLLYTDFEYATALEGALFNLYRYVGGEDAWVLLEVDVASDENGRVRFEPLATEARYMLVETVAPASFRVPTGHWYIEVYADRTIHITHNIGGDVDFIFHEGNWFVGNLIVEFTSFSFFKMDEVMYTDFEHATFLPGAVFELYRYQNGDWMLIDTQESDEDGFIQFMNLTLGGNYKLVEVAAPVGYQIPRGYWLIGINEDGAFSITAEGELIQAFLVHENQLYLGNLYEFALPGLGGLGINQMLAFVGLFMIVAAICTFLIVKKRQKSIGDE